MASFQTNNAEIHYDDYGTGFPILLIAPGGMKSEASFWNSTPWNPISQLSKNVTVDSFISEGFVKSMTLLIFKWKSETNNIYGSHERK